MRGRTRRDARDARQSREEGGDAAGTAACDHTIWLGDGRRRRLGAATAANWTAAHRTAAQRKAAQRKAAQRRSGRRRRSGQRSSGAHHLTRRGLRGGLQRVSTTYRARVARPRGYANNAAQPNHMTVGLSSIRWTDAQRRAARSRRLPTVSASGVSSATLAPEASATVHASRRSAAFLEQRHAE